MFVSVVIVIAIVVKEKINKTHTETKKKLHILSVFTMQYKNIILTERHKKVDTQQKNKNAVFAVLAFFFCFYILV